MPQSTSTPYPKSYNRQNKRRQRTRTVQPRSFPVARSYNYVGRYVDNAEILDPGIASPAWRVFNLLSLFDPDTTGVGHQPIGFDQFVGTMYDHYTVTRCQVRVQFATNDPTYPQNAILALQDKAGTTSDPSLVIENGRCVSQVLGPRNGGSQVVTLTLDVDMNLFFGRSVLDGDKYMGTSSSSPVEGVYLHVGLAGPQSINTLGCYVWTELIYHAHLSEPAVVAQS